MPRGLGGKPFVGPGPFDPPELGGDMSCPRLFGNGPPSPYLDMFDNWSYPPIDIGDTGASRLNEERRKNMEGVPRDGRGDECSRRPAV